MSSRPIFEPEMDRLPPVSDGDLILRRGGHDDLGSVLRVMREAFDTRYGEGWNREQCAGILPMPGVALIVALDRKSGETLGFTLSRCIADEAELLLIAVDKDAQGRGVGSLLLADFLALADDRCANRVHLEVRDGNPAIGLYERNGFKIAGRRRDYYKGDDSKRFDALTLVRTN